MRAGSGAPDVREARRTRRRHRQRSSVAARLGAPDAYLDYSAAKAAIDAMTIGLAKEVAADGIRVNPFALELFTRIFTPVPASQIAFNGSKSLCL